MVVSILRLRWIFILLPALLLISCLAFAEVPVPTPKLKLTTSNWDFGTILSGRIVSHIFILKNTGQANLILSAENTSCQCTTATFIIKALPEKTADEVTVPSGRKVKLKVTLDTKNKLNQVKNAVFITSNDPGNPVVIINIKAQVQQQETR
jgi:hypothetical protein